MADTSTLILLVRHGETTTTGKVLPGRAKGLHLSDRGRSQAEFAASRIAEASDGAQRKVVAVYASPLERTKETAAPISEALGLRTRISKGLVECDFGDWTGQRLTTLRKRREWSDVQARPSEFRFPGGESFVEMQTRIWTDLQRIRSEHPASTVVAVSHADPIKAAVAAALGLGLDMFQRLVVSPCSITPILFTPTGPIVLAINSTGDDLSQLVPS
ncbi:MAG: histidine phosphatase family protein [Microthrixaceae bacterium]